MDSEELHTKVCELFKGALSRWDWDTNPLEWEGLPASISALIVEAMQGCLDESRTGVFGAPFHVAIGPFVHFKRPIEHTPFPDTVLKVELHPFAGSEDWAGASFNLADAIIKDADDGDQGWTVGHAIHQLEGTIRKLKTEAGARGWDTTYEPGEQQRHKA